MTEITHSFKRKEKKKENHSSNEPNLQSHAFLQTYGAILPTSLTYIDLSTRSCSPWRPAAVMSTIRRETIHAPLGFQGPSMMAQTPQNSEAFFCASGPFSGRSVSRALCAGSSKLPLSNRVLKLSIKNPIQKEKRL